MRDERSNIALLEGTYPVRIQCDNGYGFISKEVDRWAYENKMILDYSRPGKPTDNPYIESFNGKFRAECLSVNWFLILVDASEKIEQWKWEYKQVRPHFLWMIILPKNLLNCMRKTPENSN